VKNISAAVQQEKLYIWLYVFSGKLILAVMYFRRAGIDGRSYAAAPTQVSQVFTPPASAAKVPGVGLRQMYSGAEYILRALSALWQVILAAMYLRRVQVVSRTFVPGAPPMKHVSTALRLRH
jgi:hypothetical protein